MWDNAETVALLDREGFVRAVSRNEEEAEIRHVLGLRVIERVHPNSYEVARDALQGALNGKERDVMVAAFADDGSVFWSRVRCSPSPVPELPVIVHTRKLPRRWGILSPREQELIAALHETGMNPKRAAKELGITLNTLNAHRRSICQKCDFHSVGDFWVFVEHCR
jgi:DNA-binding NarL/FixJ family response regulator